MDQTNGQTIHFAQLPEAKPGEALSLEWNTYRHEVGRLLAEGHEGKFVLIKDQAIIGLYATEDEAVKAGYERYLRQPFLVHQIQERERVVRLSWQCSPCHT